MPIGDLLAQISGDKSTASSTTTSTLSRVDPLPLKRKPDQDLRGDGSKAQCRASAPQRLSHPPRPVGSNTPSQLQRMAASNDVKLNTASSSKLATAPPKQSRPSTIGRPPSKPATPSTTPKAPPKKGSFAEILARGQRAQAVMGQVGKIQHKKVEKGPAKGKGEAKATRLAKGNSSTGYKGTSKTIPRNGTNGSASLKQDVREGSAPQPRAAASKRAAAEEEAAARKTKKVPQATTGYTGTARPKPGNPSRNKDATRGGALLNAPLSRHGSSKRSRFTDDYDEELDDFIEYDDDDDDDGRPRYYGASDGSSDMEAGLDELDVEERRAEHLARQEDIEEERLERNLKAAKEAKKRQALEMLRAGRRH